MKDGLVYVDSTLIQAAASIDSLAPRDDPVDSEIGKNQQLCETHQLFYRLRVFARRPISSYIFYTNLRCCLKAAYLPHGGLQIFGHSAAKLSVM